MPKIKFQNPRIRKKFQTRNSKRKIPKIKSQSGKHTDIGHTQGTDEFTREIVSAGCVNDIDLILFPGNVQQGRENRTLSFGFKFVIIAHGISTLYRTASFSDACFKQHAFGEGFFSLRACPSRAMFLT